MKKNGKRLLAIAVGLALLALFVVKLKTNKDISENRIYQYHKDQPISVTADTVRQTRINAESVYSGIFEPNKETKLSAEVQGKINAMMVDNGSVVNRGQSLVQLDNSLFKLQLQSVEVQIEGLEADVKRYSVLAQADAIQGVQLEKAELGLKSAKVQKATLQEQINKTNIKAPFNGIVTAKLTEEGAFAAPGVPLIQISDLSILKFTVNVSENDLRTFIPNQNYTITSDAYSEVQLSGKTTLIGSKANMGSNFPVQFEVKNTSDLKIKSGMFGKIHTKASDDDKGFVIASSTITGTANQPQVYLIKNGKAVLQPITVSEKMGNQSVISHGLKEGDVIVTSGLINLFDQANVTIKKISRE